MLILEIFHAYHYWYFIQKFKLVQALVFFKVFVAPATGEARRLELASFPDSGVPGRACTFTVLTHRAPGNLEAKVHTPSNKIESIDIVPIDEGESYALRFIPTEVFAFFQFEISGG